VVGGRYDESFQQGGGPLHLTEQFSDDISASTTSISAPLPQTVSNVVVVVRVVGADTVRVDVIVSVGPRSRASSHAVPLRLQVIPLRRRVAGEFLFRSDVVLRILPKHITRRVYCRWRCALSCFTNDRVPSSSVETGRSGGSMNRGPRTPRGPRARRHKNDFS